MYVNFRANWREEQEGVRVEQRAMKEGETHNGVRHVGVVALELDGDGRQARHDEQVSVRG